MAMYGPHTKTMPAHQLELFDVLVNYHDSGAYRRDIDTVGQQALAYLNGLETVSTPQAMVLDLDETSWFNNWPKLVNPEIDGPKAWTEWIQKAEAPPIGVTLELFEMARKKNIEVFFITGRYQTMRDFTQKNLENAGFKGWRELFLYPTQADSDRDLVFPEAATYKTAVRWSIASRGYRIVLNMGDQESDITGGFAEKTFKLPNPFYTVI